MQVETRIGRIADVSSKTAMVQHVEPVQRARGRASSRPLKQRNSLPKATSDAVSPLTPVASMS